MRNVLADEQTPKGELEPAGPVVKRLKPPQSAESEGRPADPADGAVVWYRRAGVVRKGFPCPCCDGSGQQEWAGAWLDCDNCGGRGWFGIDAEVPTTALPGTRAKQAVLQVRSAVRAGLWCEGDA